MYKASGAPLPAYSSPVTNNSLGGPAKRHGMPASRTAFSVLPPPHDGGGGSNSSCSNGGGGTGWSAADGRGGGKGKAGAAAAAAGEAGGGAVYRKDSFVHKRTSWKYTLDWVRVTACFKRGKETKIDGQKRRRRIITMTHQNA